MDAHLGVIESLLEGGVATEESISAKRAAEQAVLEEEIRKRREKVKAWQESKRLQEEQAQQLKSSSASGISAEPAGSKSGASHSDESGAAQATDGNTAALESKESEQFVQDAAAQETEKHHGWSLEDDDEEQETEDSGAGLKSVLSEPLLGTLLQAPGSPLSRRNSIVEEDDYGSAVFQNLAATPSKLAHSESNHTAAAPQRHVTAVSLAAVVTGGTGAVPAGSSNLTGAAGAAGAAATKRRMSRLKSSKWDTDSQTTDAPADEAPTSVHSVASSSRQSSAASSAVTQPVPVAAPFHTSSTAVDDDEVDPLEAFMSSLYDGGDVAEQKELQKSAKPAHEASNMSKVITMEDILAGNVPGESESSSRRRSNLNAAATPPSPKFAPSINNYPSSSSLMAKTPSLRTLAMADSTSFDSVNRGWESDAGENQYAVGASVGEMDIDDDNGEIPWHLMSNAEKQRHQQGPAGGSSDGFYPSSSAGAGANAGTARPSQVYMSESESDAETNETPEEREAREVREKQEFIEAIRRARAEEDVVYEKLSKMDESIAASQKGAGSNSAGGSSSVASSSSAQPSNGSQLGRIFSGDGDMIEETEVGAKRRSALEIMEEARKGKMLKEVDHSKVVYIPFRKNLYIMPRALSKLSEAEVVEKREDLQIKVRGKGCPVPVDTWEQCGLSDRVLETVHNLQLKEPFPIQKQAIPAIMCGRDVIGVAKTGSGKTLAFLLPMLRHILDQPPLMDGEGPIGLIMAPARELASQIFQEAKKFTKPLGLRVTCIYGGAGVAEQIADLKRGSEIVVCTPGRMIDILCMQAGKLVSLKRVTMVVMDEADRMFDMGFEPQIKMIVQNVRPDRQTVLFSATFPKQIEKLARNVLKLPLEIIVGERSTVNKDITQIIEVHEEEDKFLRLLQLLGVWYEKGSVLIFVDKQEKCDQLFQDLLKLGYPCLSLHGGKDQVDRDHTLHEFKTGIKTVMVATSVAGRGLDVPDIVCVVNYHCPNHVEDYVHRVGRTGRAGRKGTAYTFVSQREDQYAPSMVKLLQKANQPVPQELTDLAEAFKQKVARGEANWVSSGFEGKGFTFDASEMNETQKVASMQRKAYEREQGLDAGAEADTEDGDEENGADDRESNLNGAGLSNSRSSASLAGAAGAVTAPVVVAAPVAPVFTADMTPLERAKALAASIAANRLGAGAGASSTGAPTGGPVDPQAALARAKLIAMQMAAAGKGGGVGGAPGEEHFSDELEINDYPHQVCAVFFRSLFADILPSLSVQCLLHVKLIVPNLYFF